MYVRLWPRLDFALADETSFLARQQRLLINGAIGLQVAVGAVTTGVAAAGTHVGANCSSLPHI